MLRVLRECDIFRKLPHEHKEAAAEANESLLSLLCRGLALALIAALTCSEVWTFASPQRRQRFDIDMDSSVDASAPRKVRILLNLTVHDFPCIDLSLDYQDVMGTRAVDVTSTIFKQRLHPNGSFVGETLRNDPKDATVRAGMGGPSIRKNSSDGNTTCETCYGALPPGECCNTCSDVLYAYRIKRWAVPRIESISQCKHDPLSSSGVYQPPQIIPFSDYSSDDYLPRFTSLGGLGGSEARITTPFRSNISLEPLKSLRSIYNGKSFKPLVLNFTGAHFLDFLDEDLNADSAKPWSECVRRNVIVHGYDFGEALLVDLAAHGARYGCHKNDCTKTDVFTCASMDECAEVCGKVAACKWWSHGLDDGTAKCWIRTGRHGREKRYGFSSGARTCSPATTTSAEASTSAAAVASTTVAAVADGGAGSADGGADASSDVSGGDAQGSPPPRRLLSFEDDEYDSFSSRPFSMDFGAPLHMPMFGADSADQKEALKRKEQAGESCQIHGYFDTNKVPGNFHIGTHGSSTPSYLSFMSQPTPPTQNMQHTINSLAFAEVSAEVGGVAPQERQSLDGFESPKAFTFQYYVTVSPSTVQKPNGLASQGYQYRAGSFVTNELIGPAVFFRLDIDPIRVTYYTEGVTWSKFAVNICAVVGGSIAIAAMLAQLAETGLAFLYDKD